MRSVAGAEWRAQGSRAEPSSRMQRHAGLQRSRAAPSGKPARHMSRARTMQVRAQEQQQHPPPEGNWTLFVSGPPSSDQGQTIELGYNPVTAEAAAVAQPEHANGSHSDNGQGQRGLSFEGETAWDRSVFALQQQPLAPQLSIGRSEARDMAVQLQVKEQELQDMKMQLYQEASLRLEMQAQYQNVVAQKDDQLVQLYRVAAEMTTEKAKMREEVLTAQQELQKTQSELLDTLRSILGDGVEARQALMRIMSGKPANAAPAAAPQQQPEVDAALINKARDLAELGRRLNQSASHDEELLSQVQALRGLNSSLGSGKEPAMVSGDLAYRFSPDGSSSAYNSAGYGASNGNGNGSHMAR